jgi:hypothetical protein
MEDERRLLTGGFWGAILGVALGSLFAAVLRRRDRRRVAPRNHVIGLLGVSVGGGI